MDATKDSWNGVKVGDPLPPLERTITQEQINTYAEINEDENPIHTDPEFAGQTRYRGTIAHGALILALVSQCMTNWNSDGWLIDSELEAKFIGPVYPEDTVLVSGGVVEIYVSNDKVFARCEFQTTVGERTVLVGQAELRL